ncbi:MAG: peptidoglycan DD-metalloendopeptidase family protein [Flavobacteriales bacterium]|nr:peptidoglycan DD-metalloendopeptidase family protein [Flavobacteriales bacterium]
MRKALLTGLFFSCFINISITYSQDRKALEDQKKKISSEIAYTNKLLSEVKKQGAMTLDEISLLDKKISLRKKMIQTISRELRELNKGINKNQKKITELEFELAVLKEDYASLIELSYKTKNTQSWLMYVFASEDLAQANKRTRYLKEISKLRERQAALIELSKSQIQEKNAVLISQKDSKKQLLIKEQSEKKELDRDKNTKEFQLSNIKGNEQDLRAKLKKKEEQRKRLAKEIERLIAAEMKPKSGKVEFSLTPEEKLIGGNFVKNKGKLPWPVERGVITGRFGSHPHPELKGIVVTNNGIDISTEKGAMVRTVFKGTVTGLINIPGAGQAVMVKHGSYWTVYSNLAQVFVSKGETVDTKESIGTLLQEGSTSKAHIEFWMHSSGGMRKLDPIRWIAN